MHPNSPGLSPPCPREHVTAPLTSVRLLTVGEVAARLGVSKATAYRLVELGKVPHVRIMNSIRIRSGDIELLVRHVKPSLPVALSAPTSTHVD